MATSKKTVGVLTFVVVAVTQVFYGSCQFEGESIKFKLAAINLPNRDIDYEGVSDPYVILFSSTQREGEHKHWEQFGQTKPVKDSLSPQWDEVFVYQYIEGANQTWRFFVIDKDDSWFNPIIDDPLGRVDVEVEDYLTEIRKVNENSTEIKSVQLFLTQPLGGALVVTPITE